MNGGTFLMLHDSLFLFLKKFLFIYFWLPWVFVTLCGLSLVVESRGYSLLRCMGFSLWGLLLLQSTGSVVVAHGCGCSAACGIFPDQGLNPCPLHWQADSYPLCYQGSPWMGAPFENLMKTLEALKCTHTQNSAYPCRGLWLLGPIGWPCRRQGGPGWGPCNGGSMMWWCTVVAVRKLGSIQLLLLLLLLLSHFSHVQLCVTP